MSVWVGRWRSRCRVEGRRFSGSVEAKRDASPRSVHLRGRLAESGRGGLPALWRNAKEVLRERNLGAVTEPVRMVSGFGRHPPPRSPARDGFLTPIRSPAAPETSTSTGASRKIGGKTACGSMRPGPTALRYLCGRNGCHPPGRHSRAGAESRDTPPAFRRQCRSPGVPPEPPGGTPGPARNPGHPACIPSRCRSPGVPPEPPDGTSESSSLGGVAPLQPTPTGATPTPTTAIAHRWRINRPGKPYLRSRNPKRTRLWST